MYKKPPCLKGAVQSYNQLLKLKGRCAITRFFIFLLSYGILVVSISHIVFYFNYRSLGYEWNQIFYFIIRTADFTMFVISAVTLFLTVSYRGPSRAPFSEELQKR